MDSKSDNTEIMINDRADEVTEEVLNHSKIDTKITWKNQWNVVSLSLIVFIYYTINATE